MNQENEITASLTQPQVSFISDRKRAANRRNARRSTGPRTEAGKGRSRWNAIRHGLLVKEVPANHWPYLIEDPGPFKLLIEALVGHFDPVGPVEGMLVELIAQCYWRQRRFQRAENAEIRLALMYESARQAVGDETSQEGDGPDTHAIFEQARQSIDRLGHVEADLQELVLHKLFFEQDKESFIAANKEALELVRSGESSQCSPGLKIQMKRSRSKLLRQLEECEDRAHAWDNNLEDVRRKNREAAYLQHLALPESMDTFLRYETANQRQLYRALEELEHLQYLRRGGSVAPTRRLGK
jgi:hypothetical protein